MNANNTYGQDNTKRNRELSTLLDRLWRGSEGESLISRLTERYGEIMSMQVKYNIDLLVHSQTLTEFYGVDNPEFEKALENAFNSRRTKTIYFLDVLGAHAWANPRFHSYLYKQIPAYFRRNHSNIWNLTTTNRLIKQKIDQRLARYVDIDDVMPNYGSGGEADLNVVRILSWGDDDIKSTVAQDLIDFHKTFNIPLFYLPQDYVKIGYGDTMAEFHLAVDIDNEIIQDGCWTYQTPKEGPSERKRWEEGALQLEPREAIQRFLTIENCVFALEKRRELI